MRVLEVTQRYPPALGGVEIHVEAIARGIRAAGHEVEIVTTDLARDRPFTRLRTAPPTDPFPVRRHRAVHLLPAPHGLGIVAPGMGLDLLTARADVVHAHAFGMAPTWLAVAARRLRSTPLVIETHADAGRGTSGSRAYARAVTRLTLRPADRIVVQTHLEASWLSSLGAPVDRIALIPDGIDLSEFAGLPARASSSRGTTVLFVGRLYPEQKGLEPLVRAMARVPRELGLELRLVGEDWGGVELVQRLGRELGVADRITMTGPLPRDALLLEYARADLFVLPSLFEPYGIVLTEAMAAGYPSWLRGSEGFRRWWPKERTRSSARPTTPSPSRERSNDSLGTESCGRDLLAAGRVRVEQFSWKRVIPQWIRLFESVMSRRR